MWRGRVHFPEQGSGWAEGQGSDEARSLLLHVVLLALLHPPADEQEQQRTQRLVAHLQAQVPVGQEETAPVRGRGASVARVLGRGHQEEQHHFHSGPGNMRHYSGKDPLPPRWGPCPSRHETPNAKVLIPARVTPPGPEATLQPQPVGRVQSSQHSQEERGTCFCRLGAALSQPSLPLPHGFQTLVGPLKPTLPTASGLCDDGSR